MAEEILPKEKVYCCKKWVSGVLQKWYSATPCVRGSGAVRCDAPDPPEPPGPIIDGDDDDGGIRDPACLQSCRDARRQAMRDLRGIRGAELSRARERIEQEYRLCRKDCSTDNGGDDDDDDDDGTQKPCVGGFLLPKRPGVRCRQGYTDRIIGDDHWCCPKDKVIDGVGPCPGKGHELPFGSSQCEEGFSIKKDDKGNFWCCSDEDVIPGGNPCSGGGGYELLVDVGFPGGGGDPWAETPGMNRSGEWEGHYVWDPTTQKYYTLKDALSGAYEGLGMDLVCKKFHTRTKSSDGRTWCCPSDGDEDGNGDGNGGPGGEFEWSGSLKDLLSRIMERANYLLDYPRGLTPQERQAVINYAIEGVKAGEPGAKQTKQDELARIGMLGSGFEQKELDKISRETRQETSNVRREIAISELDKRFSELMGTTGMVQGLTGTLMEGEKIPEILSGARRQEGQQAINAFLAFLQGSGAGGNQAYWQAIMSQLLGSDQGGGGDFSWLYYLPYLTR
ncbi:hypothetical protein LCGC14_0461040 [marine sediment metagenome]|uniref:Uncharacterized protein n=1 Tax=marine sediment metagenome TaxID=412755 RepID=A0A0F9SXY5_9ZZZZ|nr:hypothetical protein [bacterium]